MGERTEREGRTAGDGETPTGDGHRGDDEVATRPCEVREEPLVPCDPSLW
jgi:hypothetical protein